MEVYRSIVNALLAMGLTGALLLSSVNAQATEKVIVLFEEDVSTAQIDDFLANWKTSGVSTVMRLPFISGAVLNVPSSIATSDLAEDEIVESLETDQAMELQAVRATGEGGAGEGGAGEGGAGEGGATSFITPFDKIPRKELPWGILNLFDLPYDPLSYTDSKNNRLMNSLIPQALDQINHIKVAVLDTGIDSSHGNLEDSVKGGIDLVNFIPGMPNDDNGHGTHVAGTLVAWQYGIVPLVQLYVAKVLDDDAAGDISTLVMALQWAIDNDVDVVNMSIGFRDDNPAVRLAVQKAYEAGITLVAAVGNHSNWEDDDGASGEGGAGEGGAGEGGAGEGGAGEGGAGEGGAGEGGAGEGGAGEGGAGADGGTGNGYSVMYPAAYPEVIAVAAMDPYQELAWFSNTGPELDLIAPGVDTASTSPDYSYGISNGTSMATPHVTGAVALMLALARDKNVTLTPDDVKQILVETSSNGIVNLVPALEAVDNLSPSQHELPGGTAKRSKKKSKK